MKRNGAILACCFLSLTSLFACANGSSNHNYYTVEVFADYEGMEEDLANLGHYRRERSFPVARGYALKNQKFLSEGLLSYKNNAGEAYRYRVSQRSAAHGYAYAFSGFAGFYNDGAAIDLSRITADCEVFCTFSLEKEEYLVTVRDAFGITYKDFSHTVAYDTKVEENEDLLGALNPFPDHDITHDRDAYYMSYEPIGWYVYQYKSDDEKTASEKSAGKDVVVDEKGLKNSKGEPITDLLPKDDLNAIKNYAIKDRTVFEAAYAEGVEKTYRVDLEYQLRVLDGYASSGKPLYRYEAFAEAPDVAYQNVVYGKGINEEALAVEGYRIVGSGKDGSPDQYGESEDVPELLRGTNITSKVIKFNCHITVLYEVTKTAEVRFHADLADFDQVPADTETMQYVQTVTLGDNAISPDLVHPEAMAGYRFTGKWSKTKFSADKLDYDIYDIGRIEETGTVDLYPILLPKTISFSVGEPAYALTFNLDIVFGGYRLSNIAAGVGTSFDDSVIPDAKFPTTYPYVGIEAFGEGKDVIETLKLGSHVSSVAHGEFVKLKNAASIDLSASKIKEINSRAFTAMMHLVTVKLPATLERLGDNLFAYSPNVASISIDMTEAEVEAKIQSGDFYQNWASGLPVTYKAA